MIPVPTHTTERLILRSWREEDLEPLAAIVADTEVTRYMFEGKALGLDEARAAIQRRLDHWREDNVGYWALELRESGELIGWTGLQRIRYERGIIGEVEVGWMLGRQWWGKGYAPEAAAESLRWGFRDLDLPRIYAFCMPGNEQSQRVMQKIGMHDLGEITDIRDESTMTLYGMTREQWLGMQDGA